MGTTRVLGLAVGGLGLAGIVAGSVFGLMTAAEINQQKSNCASPTNCPNHGQALSDHSTGSTDGTISTVAFVAGGVLLATGGILFFTGGRSEQPPGVVLAPSVGPAGAGMTVRGTF
jgi:hypothetical protein